MVSLYIVSYLTGLRPRPRCRKKIAFWSAGPKCGNYFRAAESGQPVGDVTTTK